MTFKKNSMNIPYFNKKKWIDITREERFFCFELYQELKKDLHAFLKLIESDNLSSVEIDLGVEVCFYRDLLKLNGMGIHGTGLPPKRTFDLALFSEKELIIIEAKAQQGFDNKQIEDFNKDKENIKKLFNTLELIPPEVKIVGIHSSLYHPTPNTSSNFSALVTWKELAHRYQNGLFNRADEIYRK